MNKNKMKRCSQCKTEYKNVENNFYKKKAKKDGYSYWCKKCSKIKDKIYQGKRKEKTKITRKIRDERYKLEHGETRANKWARENLKKANQYQRNYYKKNAKEIKYKNKCRNKTKTWFKQQGIDRTKQICVVCNNKAETHHNNYDDYKDITWLCPEHHVKLHTYLKNICLRN